MSKSAINQKRRGNLVSWDAALFAVTLFVALVAASTATLAQVATAPESRGTSAKIERRGNKTLIDETIPEDKEVEATLKPYSVRVRALQTVIGKLEGNLRKTGLGGGTLGNFVADGLRAQASARLSRPIVLAIINSGGLRKNTISEGELRASDIFELLPFENELVQIDLTGEQVLRLLGVVVANREPQSGARLKYRQSNENRPKLVSATLLVDGKEQRIDPQKVYSILTIDYLIQIASGRFSIFQEGKNVRPLGITMRDALIDYVKSETAAGRTIQAKLDGRFISEAAALDRKEK